MSLALVAAPTPTDAALARLATLHADLARPDLELEQAAEIHDQAAVLLAYCHAANVAFDIAWQAVEAKLRAERRCGALLDEVIAHTATWPSHKADRRRYLPKGFLHQIGLSGSQASRWRVTSRLPDDEFEARLEASRAARRELSTTQLVRAAARFAKQPGGRRPTSTITRLKRIYVDMRKVRTLATPGEIRLAQQIADLGATWASELQGRSQNYQVGSSAPNPARDITCLLCGRPQPPGKPPRCPSCRGAWMSA